MGFSVECLTADFLQFFAKKTSKFGFRADGWVLTVKPKYFRDFLEDYKSPEILSLTSFGNS